MALVSVRVLKERLFTWLCQTQERPKPREYRGKSVRGVLRLARSGAINHDDEGGEVVFEAATYVEFQGMGSEIHESCVASPPSVDTLTA